MGLKIDEKSWLAIKLVITLLVVTCAATLSIMIAYNSTPDDDLDMFRDGDDLDYYDEDEDEYDDYGAPAIPPKGGKGKGGPGERGGKKEKPPTKEKPKWSPPPYPPPKEDGKGGPSSGGGQLPGSGQPSGSDGILPPGDLGSMPGFGSEPGVAGPGGARPGGVRPGKKPGGGLGTRPGGKPGSDDLPYRPAPAVPPFTWGPGPDDKYPGQSGKHDKPSAYEPEQPAGPDEPRPWEPAHHTHGPHLSTHHLHHHSKRPGYESDDDDHAHPDEDGRHPSEGGEHASGGEDYPSEGEDYHPSGKGQHPSGGGRQPSGGGKHPSGGGGHPNKGNEYPSGDEEYPSNEGEHLSGPQGPPSGSYPGLGHPGGDHPGGIGEYPIGEEVYPGEEEAPYYPGEPGATDYPLDNGGGGSQPGGSGGRPGRPGGRPGRPGGSGGRPGMPGGPGGRPGRPGGPGGGSGTPGRPGRPGGRPGSPGSPGRPGGSGGRPGSPGRPAGPGGRPGSPGRPARPGSAPARPGHPGGSGGRPGSPGHPGGSEGRPGIPGYPGESVGWPGSPGQPGSPGGPGGQPGIPGRPGLPGGGGRPGIGGRPGSEGRPGSGGSPGRPGDEGAEGGEHDGGYEGDEPPLSYPSEDDDDYQPPGVSRRPNKGSKKPRPTWPGEDEDYPGRPPGGRPTRPPHHTRSPDEPPDDEEDYPVEPDDPNVPRGPGVTTAMTFQTMILDLCPCPTCNKEKEGKKCRCTGKDYCADEDCFENNPEGTPPPGQRLTTIVIDICPCGVCDGLCRCVKHPGVTLPKNCLRNQPPKPGLILDKCPCHQCRPDCKCEKDNATVCTDERCWEFNPLGRTKMYPPGELETVNYGGGSGGNAEVGFEEHRVFDVCPCHKCGKNCFCQDKEVPCDDEDCWEFNPWARTKVDWNRLQTIIYPPIRFGGNKNIGSNVRPEKESGTANSINQEDLRSTTEMFAVINDMETTNLPWLTTVVGPAIQNKWGQGDVLEDEEETTTVKPTTVLLEKEEESSKETNDTENKENDKKEDEEDEAEKQPQEDDKDKSQEDAESSTALTENTISMEETKDDSAGTVKESDDKSSNDENDTTDVTLETNIEDTSRSATIEENENNGSEKDQASSTEGGRRKRFIKPIMPKKVTQFTPPNLLVSNHSQRNISSTKNNTIQDTLSRILENFFNKTSQPQENNFCRVENTLKIKSNLELLKDSPASTLDKRVPQGSCLKDNITVSTNKILKAELPPLKTARLTLDNVTRIRTGDVPKHVTDDIEKSSVANEIDVLYGILDNLGLGHKIPLSADEMILAMEKADQELNKTGTVLLQKSKSLPFIDNITKQSLWVATEKLSALHETVGATQHSLRKTKTKSDLLKKLNVPFGKIRVHRRQSKQKIIKKQLKDEELFKGMEIEEKDLLQKKNGVDMTNDKLFSSS